jgi:DNA-binding CsgD family transcriptional regulator/tetratricopeptide (TPR) repeat protein
VGRARELEQLDRALAVAAQGSPRVVLVLGPTGIGKTTLLRRFAERCGVPLRAGGCLPFGAGDVPYLPFIELLRVMVQALPPGELLPILGPARGEVARLLPELGPPAHREEDPGLGRALLFEQLRGVAERLGARTTRILAIDDLQWADASTRDLILFLARNVRAARLLLLLTCRTDDLHPGHPFPAFAAELERGSNVERLELGGLDRAELAAQAEALLGSPPPASLVDRLLARTEGNPLFTEELLAASADHDPEAPMPPRLRDALIARLATLSTPARRLAGFAAIAGRHADTDLLGRLSGGPADALDEALRETIDGGILAPDLGTSGSYRMRHPLVREIAEADLLPGERARTHATVAAWLEERGGGPEVLAEVATHWAAAGIADRALSASIAAGSAAAGALAGTEALRHLDRALALFDRTPDAARLAGMDRIGVLERVAEAAARAGAHDRAVEATREALAAVDPVRDAARAADLRRSLRWYLWSAGDPMGALVEAEAAAVLLADAGPSPVRANTLAHMAGLRLILGDAGGASRIASSALSEARAVAAPSEEALAVGVLGLAQLRLGDPEMGLAHVREAWQQALVLGHVSGIALAYDQLAGALASLGRAAESAALAREGIAEAHRLGLDRTFGVLLRASAAEALLELGRWDEAAALVREGLAGEPSGNEGVAIHVVASRLAVANGDREAAERHLIGARRIGGARGGHPRTGGGTEVLAAAELALARGDAGSVRAVVAAALEGSHASQLPGHRAHLMVLGLRAEAEVALAARVRGDRPGIAAARSRGAALLLHARTRWPGAIPGLARAFRLQALAEAGRIDGAVPARRWEGVMEAWRSLDRPVAAAHGGLRAAEAHLAATGSGAATVAERAATARLIATAISLATPTGATPLLDALHDLARRARLDLVRDAGRPGDDGPGPDVTAGTGLTTRELEVLALLAEGRTNRQIGEALFISPKTVSVHVTNILSKLGVGGRLEAATTALRLGLVTPR